MYLNNRTTLIGFLGRDAEVRHTLRQTAFTVLSLATTRSWKDRETGERQSQTTWHRCLVFGKKLGELAATLRKGAFLQIEGEIRRREYTQQVGDGKQATAVRKSITEIRVIAIQKLDRKSKSGQGRAA